MTEMDSRIYKLEEELAYLKEMRKRGFDVSVESNGSYDFNGDHVVMYNPDGGVMAVFYEEADLKKYLDWLEVQ